MRVIVKGGEPQSLTTHRSTSHADYDNYQDKDTLRRSLVSEQRGLCCYCMGRIRPEATAMKIEHWRSRKRYPNRQLAYDNLLGACLGGEGQPSHKQYCDTRKGDQDLRWNPAVPAHGIEATLKYDPDGTIRSSNAMFDNQLNQVLNLNLAILKANRKNILYAVLQWWQTEKTKLRGPVPRARIERKKNMYGSGYGELNPYCQVAVWWLQQKLARVP